MSHTTLETITRTRIVAVVRLERYDRALDVTRALLAGGISVVEFTLTGLGAYEAISNVRSELGRQACIGVGTVLQARDAREAIAAGAQFVVTPIVRIDVIEACRTSGVPILCGALTPTEASAAHDAGAEMIKIFPARLGGPQYIRDLLAPLPHLQLVPTGGVSAENARAYLDAGAVAVGAGGNLVSARAVADGNWEQITTLARSYTDVLR